jgi:hypothetical protein
MFILRIVKDFILLGVIKIKLISKNAAQKYKEQAQHPGLPVIYKFPQLFINCLEVLVRAQLPQIMP